MADDIASALDERRGYIAEALSEPSRDLLVMTHRAAVAAGSASVLMAVVDAVLPMHRRRPLYKLAEARKDGTTYCGHEPGDERHFKAADGLLWCAAEENGYVCRSCTDPADEDLFATWPCAEYRAIAGALGVRPGG